MWLKPYAVENTLIQYKDRSRLPVRVTAPVRTCKVHVHLFTGLSFTVTSMSGKRAKGTQLDRSFKSGVSDSGYTTQDMEFSQSQTSATPTSGSVLNSKPATSGAMNIISGAGKRWVMKLVYLTIL